MQCACTLSQLLMMSEAVVNSSLGLYLRYTLHVFKLLHISISSIIYTQQNKTRQPSQAQAYSRVNSSLLVHLLANLFNILDSLVVETVSYALGEWALGHACHT